MTELTINRERRVDWPRCTPGLMPSPAWAM